MGNVCSNQNTAPSCTSGAVILDPAITSVDPSAFASTSITSVDMGPASITSIGAYAFSDCPSLTSVTWPTSGNLADIGQGAFESTGLTSVSLPNGLQTIGMYGFKGQSLTSVSIPDTVIDIGIGAFTGNPIQSLQLSNSLTKIPIDAFRFMALQELEIPGNVTLIDKYAFSPGALTRLTLPDSLQSIGEEAFSNNLLTSVRIPANVVSIGDYAFAGNPITSACYEGSTPPQVGYGNFKVKFDSCNIHTSSADGTLSYGDQVALYVCLLGILPALVIAFYFLNKAYGWVSFGPFTPKATADKKSEEADSKNDIEFAAVATDPAAVQLSETPAEATETVESAETEPKQEKKEEEEKPTAEA